MPDTKISLDELLSVRKEFVINDGVLTKAHVSPRSWNKETRSADFIMSAEEVDRHGDVVMQKGLDISHFEKNPIAFFNHKSFDTPIGSWSGVKMINGSPKRTSGTLNFVEEGVDDVADRVARHVERGTIRAASIGFIPKEYERMLDDDGAWQGGIRFHASEMTECSAVTVPSLRSAIVRGASGESDDIMSPEVVEEFLEHLKSNPAVAQLVDKELFESAYREATGNKLSVGGVHILNSAGAVIKSVESDGIVNITITSGESGGAGSKNIRSVEDPVVEPDPVIKEMEDSLNEIVEKIAPQVDEIEDEERKSVLSGFLDGIKALFKTEEPVVDEPVLASEETKSALKKRLKELEIEEVSA